MSFGFGFGFPKNYVAALFSPAQLFTGTTQGVWYDPSDINLTWRRNLLTYTEQFDNAVWSKFRSTVSVNAAVAPDGTMSSDKIVATNVLGSHGLGQAVGALPTTVSVYLKAGEYSFAAIGFNNVTPSVLTDSVFNITTGQIVSIGSDVASYSVTDVGNGWFRYSCQPSATATFSQMRVAVMADSTTISYTGDGTSGIYIWGAQLEQNSTATPYQRITDGIQDYLQYQALPVMYRDAAGTQPVTAVEQPVGLMLDKSKGLVLGPELVTNGDFSNGTTGWVTANGGAVVNSRCECTTASNFLSTTAAILTVGKWYSAEFDYFMTAGAKLRVATKDTVGPDVATIVATSQSLVTNAVTRLKIKFQAAVGGFFILQASDATFSGWVDNISVRELPGNHAFNGSGNSANFPVLSARYNLLTKSEDFSDAAWTVVAASISANSTTAPDGTVTADKFVPSTVSATHYVYQSVALISGVSYTISVKGKVAGYNRFMIRESTTSGLFVSFDVSTGSVVATSGASGICVVSANGFYTCTMTFVAPATTSTVMSIIALPNSGSVYADATFTGDGTSGIYIWGADLRVTNDGVNLPAYQRVNTSTDYDTVGFKPYLRFNGTNQWLQTNSIDFSATDKMFVSAGVRKLSDASTGFVCETSTESLSNNGAFSMRAPAASGLEHYNFASRGGAAAQAAVASGYLAPITNILSGIGNISGDQAILRINGTQAAISIADQGTGNYGNYPLYIGARAGSSLWFNGRLYGMVVAGKQASAAEITSTETYINQKTGAY